MDFILIQIHTNNTMTAIISSSTNTSAPTTAPRTTGRELRSGVASVEGSVKADEGLVVEESLTAVEG